MTKVFMKHTHKHKLSSFLSLPSVYSHAATSMQYVPSQPARKKGQTDAVFPKWTTVLGTIAPGTLDYLPQTVCERQKA